MPAPPLIDEAETAHRLASMPGWRLEDERLVRTVTTHDFRSALELVARIADPADAQKHHPDVALHWNELTLTLWTHASGGITERDFRLADSIEAILAEQGLSTSNHPL